MGLFDEITGAWRALSRAEKAAFWFAYGWLAVAMALFAGFTYDDVFICLRYAQNLADGRGYAFNPGDRVEGASDPLWILVLAGFARLGVPLLPAAKLLGAAAVLAVPWLQLAMSARLAPGRPNVAGVWLTALAAPVAFWGIDGLETGAETGLVMLGIALTLRDLDRAGTPGWSAAPAWLAVALLRPEGGLLAVPYLAVLGVTSRRRGGFRGFATALAILAFGLIALAGWRWATFGTLVPNTFWAKAANQDLWRIGRGWGYLTDFLAEWGGAVLPLMVLAALVAPGDRTATWLAAGVVLAQCAFIAAVSRDWMGAWRFIVPVWPALALLAGAGALACWDAVRGAWLAGRRAAVARTVVVAGVVAFAGFRLAGLHWWFGPASYGDRTAHRELGRWLGASFPPGTRVAIGDCGAVPWESGLPAIDLLGLNDAFIARHDPAESARYVLGLVPELIVLAVKEREVRPGAVEQSSMFPVDRMIGSSPEFAARYRRYRTWAFSAQYDLVLHIRRDFHARWVTGRTAPPAR